MLPSSSRFLAEAQLKLYTTKTASRPPVFHITVKPPNSGHPKQRTCPEWRTNHLVLNVTIFLKLPPNSGHLSITDKFFKTRRCPLIRGITVLVYKKSSQYQKLLACARSALSRNKLGPLLLRSGVLSIRPYFYDKSGYPSTIYS